MPLWRDSPHPAGRQTRWGRGSSPLPERAPTLCCASSGTFLTAALRGKEAPSGLKLRRGGSARRPPHPLPASSLPRGRKAPQREPVKPSPSRRRYPLPAALRLRPHRPRPPKHATPTSPRHASYRPQHRPLPHPPHRDWPRRPRSLRPLSPYSPPRRHVRAASVVSRPASPQRREKRREKRPPPPRFTSRGQNGAWWRFRT